MKNGRYALKGEIRSLDVNWGDVYNEWSAGNGPENSYFEGEHPSIKEIKSNYLYRDKFYDFLFSGKQKAGGKVDFWPIIDNYSTGTNMQVQMMGSFNVSFYKLGNRTLSLVQDSKSRTSFYYHLPVTNYSREETRYKTYSGYLHGAPDLTIPHKQESNTYQSYLFFQY